MAQGFTSSFAREIFLDRYALKDPGRHFAVGDTAIITVKDDPRWPVRAVSTVTDVQGEALSLRLDDGTNTVVAREAADRPLETTYAQAARRVAEAIAQVEEPDLRSEIALEFCEEIAAGRFVPAGRVWAGAGSPYTLTYFNCYVVPSPHDSRGGIIETLGQMVAIMSRGGGVGMNVSTLRPRHAIVRGVNGRSSGAVSWMDLYSRATGLVEQGGNRRGALMIQLTDWHPDLLRFLSAKTKSGMCENANISVRISDRFMEALKAHQMWSLQFPDTADPHYDAEWDGDLAAWTKKGYPVITYDTLPAEEIWKALVEGAWSSAEPGIVFSDRHERLSNSQKFSKLIATNPCGEQPLPAFGVCCLGHVNLAACVTNGKLDFDLVRTAVKTGVRFLDDVVDATPYFLPENEAVQKSERRIGLGTMGLGEVLIREGLRYGSPESLRFIDQLYAEIAHWAYAESVHLAKMKGPFPQWDPAILDTEAFGAKMGPLWSDLREEMALHGMRNVTVLTQAPTGTVGSMMGTSTGIEPFYALTYERRSRLGTTTQHVAIAEEWLAAHPGEALPSYFVGALDLSPEDHILVQAAIQKWTDSSISKTVNAPESFTVEDANRLYRLAYDSGCKGVTIYRDHSRSEQVLSADVPASEPKAVPEIRSVRPRPRRVWGSTIKVAAPTGSVFVTLNEDANGRPLEVFPQAGKGGSDLHADTEAMGRLISVALRAGVPVEEIIDQLSGIGGGHSTGFGPNKVYSVADAIAHAMREAWGTSGESAAGANTSTVLGQAVPVPQDFTGDLCPECGKLSVVNSEGCLKCSTDLGGCGLYSRC